MCKSIDFFFLFHRNCKEGEGFIQNPKGGHRPPLPLLPLLVNGLGGWKISGVQVFFPQIHQNFISPNWRENRRERNSYSQWLNYHLLLLCARHAIGFFFFCQYFAGHEKVQLLSFLWELSFVLLFFFSFYLFIFWFNWTWFFFFTFFFGAWFLFFIFLYTINLGDCPFFGWLFATFFLFNWESLF